MTDFARPIDIVQAACGDRYTIEREVGAGGMATVYSAHDVRHNRRVAIKVLRSDLAHSLGAERFLLEIAIAAKLQHPHILGLLDSGAANDLLYYAMPYVEGMSLRSRIAREGELPLEDALRLMHQLLDALAYAHGQGIIHRDVKPENVMLAGYTPRAGARWHALVTDFGVAKAMSEAERTASLTGTGIALGTPLYMAPEQAAADPHVDHRADLYAFGVLAYELLTGAPPFVGSTAQHVIAAHMTMAPPPLASRRAGIPVALERLILRCLEKRPADRWQSADDILARLDSFLTPTQGTGAFTAPRPEPVERTFRLTERVCRTLERSTLDARVLGADLLYLDNGVRSDVLAFFMQGTGQDHEMFRAAAGALPYRVIAPTFLGFETITRQRPPLSMQNHYRVMRELLRNRLDESGATTVILGGFSAGADVAMRMISECDDLPPIHGLLALGCNLSMETAWATRVFARLRPGEDDGLLEDLRAVSHDATTLDEWLTSHEYFVKVLRRMGGNLEAVRRFAKDIVAPLAEDEEGTFPRWYRAASERVRALRCVWEETPGCVRLVQNLRMRNFDTGILGDAYREDSLVIEPGAGHFDLVKPEIVARHLDAVVELARGGRAAGFRVAEVGVRGSVQA
ncbi:MAG TPA: serine/threonine-protein kinase [Gemmatimonadaceae bacterium]|nr:serine/threonine-protein kinase [Gemmatimonadaceae bacterium]